MSGGSGGPIIIKPRLAVLGGLDSVKDQLGPLKRAKLEGLLAGNPEEWTLQDAKFVLHCIRDALISYES